MWTKVILGVVLIVIIYSILTTYPDIYLYLPWKKTQENFVPSGMDPSKKASEVIDYFKGGGKDYTNYKDKVSGADYEEYTNMKRLSDDGRLNKSNVIANL
jgi:hypothetical protein